MISKPTIIEMELAIARYYGARSHMIVPNVRHGLDFNYEIDVFIVRPSGYCIEVEVKQNKSDLKADFKKKKWGGGRAIGIPGIRIKEFYYCLPSSLIESCIDLIPEDAGLMGCHYNEEYGYRVRIRKKATINKYARPITDRERIELGKLAVMRIWNLQETLISHINNNK